MIEQQAKGLWRDAGGRYLVLASLPHIPRFDRARRLPIGRETLTARLALLPAADAQETARAASFLAWQRNPAGRTGEETAREYERVMGLAQNRGLRQLIAYRFDIRTLIAGLRRRHLGHPPPQPGERWGIGPWVRHVERRYSDPDFGLQHAVPWLPSARRLLESGDAGGLDRLLFGLVWAELDRMASADRFGYDAVLAYVFKWDLVDRWLSSDAALAAQRFDTLALEALREFGDPFSASAA